MLWKRNPQKKKKVRKESRLVRQDLKTHKLKEITVKSANIEILGVKISGLDRELNCFTIYRRPGAIESRKTWNDIIED